MKRSVDRQVKRILTWYLYVAIILAAILLGLFLPIGEQIEGCSPDVVCEHLELQ